MKNQKRGKYSLLMFSILVIFLLVSCSPGNDVQETLTPGKTEGNNREGTASPSILAEDNGLGAADWKNGLIRVNNKEYSLMTDDLETFSESGYKPDDADLNTVLNPEDEKECQLSDGIHRKLSVSVKNYSAEKPCWKEHGMISNITVYYGTQEGLESPEVLFPSNITGGMGKEEVSTILGDPDSKSADMDVFYYERENDGFRLDISFEDNKISSITYRRENESAMKADDMADIQKALDPSKESSVVKNTSPSGNLKDMQIKIGKKVYAMPVCSSDLVDLGYQIDNSYVINPKTSGVPADFPGIFYPQPISNKNGKTFYVAYENAGDTLRLMANCRIASLTITEASENCSIAKGIHIGSKKQEVLDAFGKKEAEDDTIVYGYNTEKSKIQVTFTFQKDSVSQINMILTELV